VKTNSFILPLHAEQRLMGGVFLAKEGVIGDITYESSGKHQKKLKFNPCFDPDV
jgi:hypothetical protein